MQQKQINAQSDIIELTNRLKILREREKEIDTILAVVGKKKTITFSAQKQTKAM